VVNVLLEKKQRNRRGKRRVEEAAIVDFELTEEQKMIREMVRDFAENEIAPIAAPQQMKRSGSPRRRSRRWKEYPW